MKRLLTVLALLIPLLGAAQLVSNPVTYVRPSPESLDTLYRVRVSIAANTYPATRIGRMQFQQAILNGAYQLTVISNGVVIPKGVRPPRKMPLVGSGGTPPVASGLPVVSRMLVIGNSITLSGPLAGTDWIYTRGMAATADEKDYVHLMQGGLRTKNASCIVVPKNAGSALEQVYLNDNADVDNTISNLVYELKRDYGPSVTFDYIYISLGENINNATWNEPKFRTMLDKLTAAIPTRGSPVYLFRNSVWAGKESSDAFFRQLATQKGARFADMSPVRENPLYMNTGAWQNAGVDHHPNDAGMARMADISLSAISTGGSPSTPVLRGGFAEGTLSELFALAPFVPATNQVNAWPDNTEKVLQNERITFAIHKSISGSVTKVIDRRNGINTINTNALGASPAEPDKWDTGRSMDFTPYGTPKGGGFPYYWPSETDRQQSTVGDDVGYNPVNGGDNRLNRSGVKYFEARDVAGFGPVLCVQTTGLQWNMNNVRGQIDRWAFYWLEGETLRFMYIMDNFRSDTQAKHELRLQEGPFIYVVAPLHNYLCDFGNGPVRVDKPDQPRDQNGQWDTGPQFAAKNYMGAYADDGYGITLFTPYNSRFVGKGILSFYGNEYSNASSYINAGFLHDFDTPSTVAFSGYLHVGTNAEFRTWQANANVATQPFRFDFSGGRFQGWGSLNGTTTRQNGEVVWGVGDIQPYGNERGQSKFISPAGSWPAASMPKLYVNMALTGMTRVQISYIKPGQSESNVLYPLEQYKWFTVTPSGNTYQTYEFDMSDAKGWNGIISNLAIETPYTERSQIQGNEKAKMGWINTVNQKP